MDDRVALDRNIAVRSVPSTPFQVATHIAATAERVSIEQFAWIVAGVYSLVALVLLPHYQDNLYPDAISYISIAHKYLRGDFANAVNPYWAPLVSWAMVPFMSIGFDALQSIKLVSIGGGMLAIVATGRLLRCFDVAPSIARALLVSLIVVMLYFSMSMATPDLLLTACLIAYLGVVFNRSYPSDWTSGALCGALGGLAYLSKHYGLPFFIIHFTLVNAWYCFRRDNKSSIVTSACAGVATCLLIALPWSAAISARFGQFTIGTSGARTHAYAGPHTRGDTLGPHGFVAPPDATATSAWEDPSSDMLESWSPLASRENFLHQARIVGQNVWSVAVFFFHFSALAVPILVVSVVTAQRDRERHRLMMLPLTLVLYVAGYLGIWVEERYMWPAALLFVLIAGVALTRWLSRTRLPKPAVLMATGICATSFAIMPAMELVREFDAGRELRELGVSLRDQYGVRGNIAAHNQYRTPLYLTYHIGGRFFGTSNRGLSEAQVERLLLEHQINFYFVWTSARDTKPLPGFLAKYQEVADIGNGSFAGLRVYRIQ